MSLVLKVPTFEDCEQVRLWRNNCLEALRTPYPLTEEQQERFYMDVVCNKDAPHKYWSIYDDDKFIAFGGLTHISWENRIAEISLIVNPAHREQGIGEECVKLLLAEGFGKMGLATIFGEVYCCNLEGLAFWRKITKAFSGYETLLSRRKMWNNQLWDSMYFSITEDDFNK